MRGESSLQEVRESIKKEEVKLDSFRLLEKKRKERGDNWSIHTDNGGNIFIWIGEFFLWERLSSFVLVILVRD